MAVAVLIWLAVLGLGLLAPERPPAEVGPRVEIRLPGQAGAPGERGGTAQPGTARPASGPSGEAPAAAAQPAAAGQQPEAQPPGTAQGGGPVTSCTPANLGWLEATIGPERARELGFVVPTYLPPGAGSLVQIELRQREGAAGSRERILVVRSSGSFELREEPASAYPGLAFPLLRHCPGPDEGQATVVATQVRGRPAAILQARGRSVMIWRSDTHFFELQVMDTRITAEEMVRLAESMR